MNLVQVSETEWELPRSGAMRVPGRVFASERLLESIPGDPCLELSVEQVRGALL